VDGDLRRSNLNLEGHVRYLLDRWPFRPAGKRPAPGLYQSDELL